MRRPALCRAGKQQQARSHFRFRIPPCWCSYCCLTCPLRSAASCRRRSRSVATGTSRRRALVAIARRGRGANVGSVAFCIRARKPKWAYARGAAARASNSVGASAPGQARLSGCVCVDPHPSNAHDQVAPAASADHCRAAAHALLSYRAAAAGIATASASTACVSTTDRGMRSQGSGRLVVKPACQAAQDAR